MPDILPSAPPPGIALFDLDGTLVAWDCQLLFRDFIVRREPWRRIFLPVFIAFLPLAGLLGAEGMKRVFLSYLWRMPVENIAGYSREFAAALMPAIYREVKEMLEAHRREGHLLVLASASPEVYVKEIGRLLGFDISLGTPVDFGSFFPDLENHKGEAKVQRLREILPASYFEIPVIHGYTDSRADLPMLSLCRSATVVNPSPGLTAIAEDSGWEIVRPARPWRSRFGFAVRTLGLITALGKDPWGLRR